MILHHLGTSALSLFTLVTIVFLVIQARPGEPAYYGILGMNASPQVVAAPNKQMGLNHPVRQQHGIWCKEFKGEPRLPMHPTRTHHVVDEFIPPEFLAALYAGGSHYDGLRRLSLCFNAIGQTSSGRGGGGEAI